MRNGLILLSTNGDIFQEGMKLYFERWGFDVEEPAIPPMAIREALCKQPVLAVLDLPKCLAASGLLNELFNSDHSLPLLLLATDPSLLQRHYLRLQRLRNYDVIAKPCPVAELRRAVEGLLGVALSTPHDADLKPEITIPPCGWNEVGGKKLHHRAVHR